ncbi:MAG: hypothetical protein V1911_02665 [Candidatus Micrarchaeota archaeon]
MNEISTLSILGFGFLFGCAFPYLLDEFWPGIKSVKKDVMKYAVLAMAGAVVFLYFALPIFLNAGMPFGELILDFAVFGLFLASAYPLGFKPHLYLPALLLSILIFFGVSFNVFFMYGIFTAGPIQGLYMHIVFQIPFAIFAGSAVQILLSWLFGRKHAHAEGHEQHHAPAEHHEHHPAEHQNQQ